MDEEEDLELEMIRKRKLKEMMEKNNRMSGGEGGSGSGPITLTDRDFEGAVSTHDIMIVDCWAPWCMPCRMLTPILDQLAVEYSGRVVFAKLNVDENPMTARRYNTMSIPTLLVFKEGKLIDRMVGVMPKAQLKAGIDRYLG